MKSMGPSLDDRSKNIELCQPIIYAEHPSFGYPVLFLNFKPVQLTPISQPVSTSLVEKGHFLLSIAKGLL